MDRLGPLDTAFLDAEDADHDVSMAIASVAVLAGPAPSHAEFLAAVVPRLRAIDRMRQRVQRLPFDLGPPVWVDTGGFDVDYHIRRTALPEPGDDKALCRLVGRVMGQRLDRDRPLWECWVVEGLAGGHWAMLLKLHHCLADGVASAQLYNALFAAEGTPIPQVAAAPEPPRRSDGVLRAACDLVTIPLGPLRDLAAALRSPVGLARRITDTVSGLARMAAVLVPVSPSSLSGPIGRPRRYAVARASLSDMRAVGAAFDVTVNDVVLAAVSLAFRAVLLHRGERPTAHTVRAMVPVSVRAADQLDNQVSVLLPMLPVELGEPAMVLREVHRRLATLKQSKETEAGENATSLAAHEPFALVSLAIRLAARLPQRNIVTVTTNVAGSPRRLAVLGRPILELFPYVPIAVRLRTGVAALSYGDRMSFGITADFDSNPDADLFTESLERGVTDLVQAAALVGGPR